MDEPRDESGYPGFQGLEAIAKRMSEKKLPEHKTKIVRRPDRLYEVHCSVCGRLGGIYQWVIMAEHRKSAHGRGQDTGSGS